MEDVKKLIVSEIEKTENLIEEYKELTKPVKPDDAYGRISRMDAIINKSVTEGSLRKAEDKLKKLQYALQKVGSTEFGKCKKCGVKIPIQRILFIPESPYCVNCAE
jgi:DnaK suppressor protein